MVGEQADYVVDDLMDDPDTNWRTPRSPQRRPCDGRGLSYSSAHCAPPVGDKENGYRCVDCPMVPDRKEGA
jgi:hypothetical protein